MPEKGQKEMSEFEKSRIECLTKWADDNRIQFTNSQVLQIVKTTMDFREITFKNIQKALKENPNFVGEKREKKNQQRVERVGKKFPSQDEFFNHLVDNALKPSNKK